MLRRLIDVFKGNIDDHIILEGPRVLDQITHIAIQKEEVEVAWGNRIIMVGRFPTNRRWFITWGKLL